MIEKRLSKRYVVKPESFIVSNELAYANRSLPPVESFRHLEEVYDISKTELARLGVFIFGIDPGDHKVTGRQDGVIPGIDTYTSTDIDKVTTVSRGVSGIDLDAGRLAAYVTSKDRTPYSWVDDEVLFNGDKTGLYMVEYPSDEFSGKYYVRTDRDGGRSRLVVNPKSSCESMCSWCARSYQDREKLLGEKLDRRIVSPEDFIEEIAADPHLLSLGGLSAMKEVNFVSGDFVPRNKIKQADYLIRLVQRARDFGFNGEYYYAGHQAFENDGVQKI